MAGTDILNNPVWHSLIGGQRSLSIRQGRVARYRPDVSPFAAIETLEDLDTLSNIVRINEMIAILSPQPVDFETTPAWQLVNSIQITQMICDQPIAHEPSPLFDAMTPADDADMLALAKSTDPGPFELHTREMGTYYGVRQDKRLIAMAGERMHPPGWTEISGVCTSEAARGKGYASKLVIKLMDDIFSRGEKPFLHVRVGSSSEKTAVSVYEKLGFVSHQPVTVRILQRLN